MLLPTTKQIYLSLIYFKVLGAVVSLASQLSEMSVLALEGFSDRILWTITKYLASDMV